MKSRRPKAMMTTSKGSIRRLSALCVALSLVSLHGIAKAQGETPTQAATKFDSLLDGELAAPGGLTAEAVARRATAESLDLRARRAELAAAAAEVDRAAAAYLPQLTLTARYTRLSDPGDTGAGSVVAAPGAPPGPLAAGTPLVNVPLDFPVLQNHYTFQASLLVPVSDYFSRVAPAHDAARWLERSASAKVAAERNRVAADAKVAYYAWVRAKLGLVVAEQALAQAQAHLSDVKQALAAGTASPADVARFESNAAQSELFVETSKNLAEISEEQLRIALRDDPAARYRIGEDVRKQPEASIHSSDLSTLWKTALSNRAELRQLASAGRAENKRARVERAGILPRLDLFANGYYANPNSRAFPQRDAFEASWDAGVQLSWTVSDIPAAAATGRAAEARAAALDAERAALSDRVRLEVTRAAQQLRETAVAMDTTARGLAAAEESYRARRLLFQNGRATSVELLDAETDLTRARLEALAARIDARVARARLDYALGVADPTVERRGS
jgi:outer membrane protein TolC